MTGFILSILEGTLGLTQQERDTIEPCLPYAKKMVDRISDVWPELQDGEKMIAANQTLVKRLMDDIGVLLPNASALLGDGYVDGGTSLSRIKDLQSAVNSNPKTVSAVIGLYNVMQPVIVEISKEWPQVEPAYNVLIKAAARKGYSLGSFLGILHQKIISASKFF